MYVNTKIFYRLQTLVFFYSGRSIVSTHLIMQMWIVVTQRTAAVGRPDCTRCKSVKKWQNYSLTKYSKLIYNFVRPTNDAINIKSFPTPNFRILKQVCIRWHKHRKPPHCRQAVC